MLQQCELPYEARIEAALHSQLAALQYLRFEGCEWNAVVCSLAASNNNFEQPRYTCLISTCTARGGHLDTVRFLMEHGCP
eukprot:18360-Heterococcus_DN1.PRE.2